ncbi:MAG: phosphoglycerate dehydrogenase [Gammaproteobacteria bacterium CG22_combo_CG10-13_8_21_14_all_40_8]|nr:MAG: phosphoglycerate dehydrogenase [Gammaproteobacteria bacterium CG22_combo_CG10-13_8_21_14_all_40_8]
MSQTSIHKSKIKVVLLEGLHSNAPQLFKDDGYTQIECYDKALSDEELKAVLADANFVGIRSRTKITLDILNHAPKLAAIGCFCIGTNQVDLAAARSHGVPVFNAPFANTRSVAELVLGEMLLLIRGIPEKNAAAHRGQWLKTAKGSHEARGKTLGIVGYGHIGTQLGLLAESLGMQVIFFDILKKLSLGNAQAVASMEQLFAQANIVTFHVPETPQTKNLLNHENIGLLKDEAIVINASRGSVIEIPALVKALQQKKVAGAAVDVFPVEPSSNQQEFLSELIPFDNVILTPHIGGSTLEAQANIGIEVAEKLIHYSNNGSTIGAVNFPQVALPTHTGNYRLLHVHKNKPGVLSQINELFSEESINITAQYLQTYEDIGYVVTDIDRESDENILEKLKLIPGTLRSRILY